MQQLQDLQVLQQQQDRCTRLQVLLLLLGQQLDQPLPLRLQVPLLLVSSFLQQQVLLLALLALLLELLQALQLKWF